MHLDRRKTDIDVIEHVVGGVHAQRVCATSNDRGRQTGGAAFPKSNKERG